MIYLSGIIPIFLGLMVCRTDDFLYKKGVTLTCILIIMGGYILLDLPGSVFLIVIAFVFSITGDYFLSFRKGKSNYYFYGIISYFTAHLGYLIFTVINGDIQITVFLLLFIVYGCYYYFLLLPEIKGKIMSAAVFLYLLISCLSLAAAVGLSTGLISRLLWIVGISLIIISDTIIAESEFAGNRKYSILILPTYYLAHISITYSVLFFIT